MSKQGTGHEDVKTDEDVKGEKSVWPRVGQGIISSFYTV